jgi:hypothetical protein
MRLVIIESPYSSPDAAGLVVHREYALACMRDCLARGEAPLASHLLYPLVLDEDAPDERTLGIQCGYGWGRHAELVVVYVDHGVSLGMARAIEHYADLKIPHVYRTLYRRHHYGQGEGSLSEAPDIPGDPRAKSQLP